MNGQSGSGILLPLSASTKICRFHISAANLTTAHGKGFTLPFFIAELQAGKLQIPIFMVFGRPDWESN